MPGCTLRSPRSLTAALDSSRRVREKGGSGQRAGNVNQHCSLEDMWFRWSPSAGQEGNCCVGTGIAAVPKRVCRTGYDARGYRTSRPGGELLCFVFKYVQLGGARIDECRGRECCQQRATGRKSGDVRKVGYGERGLHSRIEWRSVAAFSGG